MKAEIKLHVGWDRKSNTTQEIWQGGEMKLLLEYIGQIFYGKRGLCIVVYRGGASWKGGFENTLLQKGRVWNTKTEIKRKNGNKSEYKAQVERC